MSSILISNTERGQIKDFWKTDLSYEWLLSASRLVADIYHNQRQIVKIWDT